MVRSGTTVELGGRWEKCEVALEDSDWQRMCIELELDPATVSTTGKFMLMENRSVLLIYLHGLVRYPDQPGLKESYNDCLTKENQMVVRFK